MKVLIIFIICFNFLYSKDYVVGFAQTTLQNDWMNFQVEEVKKELSKHKNIKLIVKDAKGQISKQIRQIEELIKQNVDFIITCPLNPDITPLVLKKAVDKNIKVILLSRGINSDDYTSFISLDNKMISKKAAEYLAKKINYKGTILMLQGVLGASSTMQRSEGFNIEIQKYPNIKVITRSANYLRTDAIKVMENIFNENIKFDAIYSQSDSMLTGVREASKRYNKNLDYPSVGIDFIKESKKAIKEGKQSSTFIYPTLGKEGVRIILDIINNKKIKKDIIIDTIMISKDNINEFEPIF